MLYIDSCLQIKRGHEDVIRQCFQPILDDIERMYKTYEMNKLDEVFIEEEDDGSSTFVSSNLMRNQLRGLSEISWEEKERRAALRSSAVVNETFFDHDDIDDDKNDDNLGVPDNDECDTYIQELPCERLFSNWSSTNSQSGPCPNLQGGALLYYKDTTFIQCNEFTDMSKPCHFCMVKI